VDDQEELHNDLWPPCTSLLQHLAYSTTLGEVPNYPEHLSRTVASMGHSRSIFRFKKNDPRQYLPDPNDLTQQDSFYCIYKGGLHGPQNGFRLVVAMAGVKPKFASEGLNGLGDIVRDTADLVCFTEDDGMEVVSSLDDGLEGANRVTARTVKIISDITDEDVVHTVGPDEGAIQKEVQKAVYPPDKTTGRGCLLILQPRKSVMLVKPGVVPERAAKAAFDAQVGRGSEETRFIIVEAAGTYIYSNVSDVPTFFPANPEPILCQRLNPTLGEKLESRDSASDP
jgi:hypothetical protein